MTTSHTLPEQLSLKPADLRDPFLRNMQRRFDKVFFDHNPYALELKAFPDGSHISHADAKADHIAKRLAITVGRFDWIARRVKPLESPLLRQEIVPEVLITRTRLANTLHYDLNRRLGKAEIKGRSLHDVAAHLHTAQRELFEFTAPLEDGTVAITQRERAKHIAIPALHASGIILARLTRTEPATAHSSRLAHHMAHISEQA